MRGYNGFTKLAVAVLVAASAWSSGIAEGSAATVKPPPPNGFLFCDVTTGTLSTTQRLTDQPSTKPVRLTFQGTATCDASGVVGGKAPITEAAFKFVWKTAKGATCSSLPPHATAPQRFQLKLRGLNAKNKLVGVAPVKGAQEVVNTFSNGFTNRGTAQAGATSAFANEEVTLNSYVDPDALAEQCAGAGVETLPFRGPLYVRAI